MATRKEILDLLYFQPVEIGRAVGFTDLTDLHNQWLRAFLYSTDDITLQSHRGSYKTTVLSVFLAIHAVLFPNESVIYFRKTDNDVREVTAQVQKIIKSGAMQRVSEALWGKQVELVTASTSATTTNLMTRISGAEQILGLGIGTSITGKHADIVVTDDIVNVKDRVSRAEREATKRAYQELQNIKNRGGRFINTGTPWHKEDAFTLMPNLQVFDCYSTGLITTEQLDHLRQSMEPSLFAANYELRHIASDAAIFAAPEFTDDEAAIYDGYAHIDAAYGGSDYTAYTVIKYKPDGSVVAFGKIWQKHVDDVLPEIMELHRRYRAGTVFVEKNGDKGYLAREMRSMGFTVSAYTEKMNKFLKISTYLKKAWPFIKWLRETDADYLAQVLDYTENAEHDDAPDSAASLIRKLGVKRFENI